MAKGEIILIRFPFTNLSGNKLGPPVVLIVTDEDVTVAFITTQLKWKEPTDVFLEPNVYNGLELPSLIRTNKLATLDKTLIKGRIGRLTTDDVIGLNQKLKLVLNLI